MKASSGEIILNLGLNKITNKHVFYTDSNGLFKMKRQIGKYNNYFVEDDYDNAIPGNFYPVTKFISINDTDTTFTVFNDRS